MKQNPQKTIVIIIVLIIIGIIVAYAYGFFSEKGKQAASNVPSPSLPTKDEPKLVIISSGEIALSGPGTYFVSAEHMTAPDNIIAKISGLSIGDKVILKAASNDGEIVIIESDYLKMQAPMFYLNNKNDKIVFTCDSSGICVEDSRVSIGD